MAILCFYDNSSTTIQTSPSTPSPTISDDREEKPISPSVWVSSFFLPPRVWEFQRYGFSFHTSVKAPGISSPQFWNQSELPEKDKIPSAACVWARIGRLRYDGLLTRVYNHAAIIGVVWFCGEDGNPGKGPACPFDVGIMGRHLSLCQPFHILFRVRETGLLLTPRYALTPISRVSYHCNKLENQIDL
jgi:hypothetical protein